MPRKNLILSDRLPYHVVARANNKEWFKVPMQTCWNIFEDFLVYIAKCYAADIHLFLLMSNHFHLLLSTPLSNLPIITNRLMTETARAINDESMRINHVYGGESHSTLITVDQYFGMTYKYILRNPIEAKICSRVEDYPFSTFHGKLGLRKLIVPVVDRKDITSVPEDPYEQAIWANQNYDKIWNRGIKQSLGKRVFKMSKRFLEEYGIDPRAL